MPGVTYIIDYNILNIHFFQARMTTVLLEYSLPEQFCHPEESTRFDALGSPLQGADKTDVENYALAATVLYYTGHRWFK